MRSQEGVEVKKDRSAGGTEVTEGAGGTEGREVREKAKRPVIESEKKASPENFAS